MNEIAGIPVQFFQDALAIITDAVPHFSVGNHCRGNIVGFAIHEQRCYPLDPQQPWECASENIGGSGLNHHQCFTQNLGSPAKPCNCTLGWVHTDVGGGNTNITIAYFKTESISSGSGKCAACENDHGKNPPCQFCGQVHD